MGGSERYCSCDEQGAALRLWVPDRDELLASARHAGLDLDDAVAAAADADLPFDIEEWLAFTHPVWWRSALQCRETGDGECNCGRVSLLEVLDSSEDDVTRQAAFAAHEAVLREAWDHYWSGQALRSGSPNIGGACTDCLVGGDEHLAAIFAEANELAAEFGAAIAAFRTTTTLGERVYGD
jgi:hypothetical protein